MVQSSAAKEMANGAAQIVSRFPPQKLSHIVTVFVRIPFRRGEVDPEMAENGGGPQQVDDGHRRGLALGPVHSLQLEALEGI